MAAFRRRTRFAAPLIITVAAGCSGKSTTTDRDPEKRYVGSTWSVTMNANGCRANQDVHCPPGVACNPPPPNDVECPPGSSGRNVVRIAELPDKSCAVLPPNCLEPKCTTTPTKCPLPYGQKLPVKLGVVMEIEMRNGECHVEEHDIECPPNVDCNPPAPRKIACPPGVTEEIEVDIAMLPDGTCAVVPEGCTTLDCVGAKTPCPK